MKIEVKGFLDFARNDAGKEKLLHPYLHRKKPGVRAKGMGGNDQFLLLTINKNQMVCLNYTFHSGALVHKAQIAIPEDHCMFPQLDEGHI